ncbi:MAG: phosphoglycerate kinase [Bdellovibrionota bacterium]|jgi:phosphoglycerate kinase
MKFLDEIDVTGKKVVLRFDAELPLNENGEVLNLIGLYRRIAPSLQYLKEHQAAIILLTSNSSQKSIKNIVDKLSARFELKIKFADSLAKAKQESAHLEMGEVLLCENLALNSEDAACDPSFAKELLQLGDIYVSDTFADAIKPSASTTTVFAINKTPVAGLLLKNELEYYDRSIVNPKRPFCVIIGGSRAAPRIEILHNMAQKADKLLVGGALANTFLAAQGAQMGRSLIERDLFPKILGFIGTLARRDSKVYFPVDFRIGDSIKSRGIARCVTAQEVPADSTVLDIGPATSILFEEAIVNAETILWNGPMGTIENEDYTHGTTNLIQSLGAAHGLTVAGGVATEEAIRSMEFDHRFDHISSGGQVFLDMMEGKSVPGLVALGYK